MAPGQGYLFVAQSSKACTATRKNLPFLSVLNLLGKVLGGLGFEDQDSQHLTARPCDCDSRTLLRASVLTPPPVYGYLYHSCHSHSQHGVVERTKGQPRRVLFEVGRAWTQHTHCFKQHPCPDNSRAQITLEIFIV